MYDPLLMTARENELADRLDVRACGRELMAMQTALEQEPELAQRCRDEAELDRLAASTIRANAARIAELEGSLRSAIADLVDMSNARWSEYEGTEDDLVGGYREVLGAKQ